MQTKVSELNLEYGNPTVESALQKMKNALTTFKGQGYKAIIIIHGYGSSGVGGGIKTAVRTCLSTSSMSGIVRMVFNGESWGYNKKTAISFCKQLEEHQRRILGNEGVTVVILK